MVKKGEETKNVIKGGGLLDKRVGYDPLTMLLS